jgi:hypothetical protein
VENRELIKGNTNEDWGVRSGVVETGPTWFSTLGIIQLPGAGELFASFAASPTSASQQHGWITDRLSPKNIIIDY